MSTQVQFRRGTTAAHATFTGVVGEVTVDTTKKTVVVHDGATAGGFPLALEGVPSAHAASHQNGGSDEISVAGLSGLLAAAQTPLAHTHSPTDVTGTAVITADSRLSDARTPVSHTHPESEITNLVADLAAKQPLDSDLTTIAGLTATTDNVIQSVAGAWASRTMAQLKTLLALVKGDVGLGSVDNTSDAGKPVSTAQQTALDLKSNIASPTFTGTPAAPTAAAGTNTTQLATTAFATAINNNASYRTLMQASGSHIAARAAGTYALCYGDAAAVGGTGTLYPLAVIQIVAADYPTINGIVAKLRIRAQLYTNDTPPTGNFTFGLYPITRPGTSGAAGLCIFTLGTVIVGSNGATFTAPAADLLGSAVGADFALPSDGPYVIGVVTTATVATSAHVHLHAQLQMRNA